MTAEEKEIRKQFPLIDNTTEAYLDNAATTQKPQCVLDAVADYYTKDNANPLRGLYDLSVRATDDYENARKKVADFIGANSTKEVIFTRNASGELIGSGLDLPIAQLLTKQMGGTIEIQSDYGKGTSVWVSIPCTASEIEKKRV